MTKDKVLKLALEALESGVDTQIGRVAWTEYDSCLINEAITAIKEALAPTSTQCEVQPEQEVDWKDQYEKQKRRAEMWLAKYEEVAGPAPCAVPLAQDEQISSQERVAIVINKGPKIRHYAKLTETGELLADGTNLYTTPPKRPWVGLTDDEASWCQAPSTIQTWKRIEAILKEKNT